MPSRLEKSINWGRLRHKYHRSTLKNKTKLLNEICDLSDMNRKYLIRKFNQRLPPKVKKRGPKPIYDADIYVPIIKPIWLMADQLCSKKLKVILPVWLPFYEKENAVIASDVRKKLLSMSAATLDRILKPIKIKYKTKGRSGTKPGSLIKNQIPIRTNQWEESKPGFIEADTVAHCGNSLEGDFVWSLTMSDILTTWTENRATWNKGATGVSEQIDDGEMSFPFEMKGFDCDNGSEFLNYHLIRKFADRPKEKAIQFTRSRPYKKNDNAHVEQKNWTHVRQLFGYHRFGNPVLVELMNDLYKNEWSAYQNHFIPTMKCVEKIKVNSKYKKKFDEPQTPYQRVLDCKDIPKARKQTLMQKHATLNPLQLKRDIERKLKIIFSYVFLNPKARKKI